MCLAKSTTVSIEETSATSASVSNGTNFDNYKKQTNELNSRSKSVPDCNCTPA
jgi:hypothetical protein